MIPGQNILSMALTVIGQQTFEYFRSTGRTTNSIGYDETAYAAPVCVRGSVQAVPRNLYMQLGLDLQKVYLVVYVPQDIADVQRDVSGDQIAFAGKKYQCESKTDWLAQDGWIGVLCVQIGPA